MKSLPWLLGPLLFACAEGFTKEETGSSGGAASTSGGASSGSGGAIREGGRGGTSGGSTNGGSTNGGSTNGGSNSTGGKASGGAKSSGGTGGSATSGGARATGGNNSGGSNASGGSNSGGSNATGGSDATGGAPEGGAGGMGPEIPTGGLVLWLRADHGVTVEGSGVTRWADQSGQGYDATPGSPDERPTLVDDGISGLPSVSFDGVDDVLNLPAGFEDFTQGVSIFSVRQAASIDKCWAVLELSNGSEIDDISFGQYQNAALYEVLTGVLNTGAIVPGAAQMVSAVHRITQSADMRINLANAGSATVALPVVVERAQNFIGHTQYGDCMPFPGMISELILYRRAVTSAERTAIEAYLRERWSCCTK